MKCWSLFILDSCSPISVQQCLWLSLTIQRNYILNSSLCLTFFTQHQMQWRGKMNLCLWMTNFKNRAFNGSTNKLSFTVDSEGWGWHISWERKQRQEKKEKNNIYHWGVASAKPVTGPVLKEVEWLAKYQAMMDKMLLSHLNFLLRLKTPKTEQMKGHNSVGFSRFADAYFCQNLHPLRPSSVSAMHTLVEAA